MLAAVCLSGHQGEAEVEGGEGGEDVEAGRSAHLTPLLILGDSPDQHNGLGRIGHDLAWLLSSMPDFRVGYLGRESFGRSKFPWTSYHFHRGWGEGAIEQAWEDLSQGQDGVIFTVWDATRLLWFVDANQPLKLDGGKFKRWGYFMQDAEGVNTNLLPYETASVMAGFDRILLASKWAYTLAANTVRNHPDIDWIPHGINTGIFKPMERWYARSAWNVKDEEIVIGCVMSNQERKHWATVIEAASQIEGARLWIHTDLLTHYWSIPALTYEYGIQERVIIEDRALTDRELAMRYSACDVTVVISGGEGFCYPLAESLACGTPIVTGAYGAGSDFDGWKVPPKAYTIHTVHNVKRAVYKASDVAQAIRGALAVKDREWARTAEHLEWTRIGRVWKKWFLKGVCDGGC